jgi:tRNA (guanine37-N1)-methyltransferase
MSPRGAVLNQEQCERFAKDSEQYGIICWHYEGIDERIFDLFDIREVSIGDYVLSSGELAALVYIDSMIRLIPGVLTEESLEEESFSKNLDGKKEYPQYSRPEIFEELAVPKILLSGDTKKIKEWKKQHVR